MVDIRRASRYKNHPDFWIEKTDGEYAVVPFDLWDKVWNSDFEINVEGEWMSIKEKQLYDRLTELLDV